MFNILFIVLVLPESLPEVARKATWGSAITWEQADPFAVSAFHRELVKTNPSVKILKLHGYNTPGFIVIMLHAKL